LLVAEAVPMPSSYPPFAINASAEINSTAIVPAVAALLAPIVSCWVLRVDVDAKINQMPVYKYILYHFVSSQHILIIILS